MKKIKFARFGGLSPVPQKGYDPSMPGFHSPPSKKGFYAFVWPYYVPFMLGGTSWSGLGTKHSKFEFVKDRNGNLIEYDAAPYRDENFMKKYTTAKVNDKHYWVKPKKVKTFYHTGEIWHHLGENIPHNEILQTKGTWYLTSYESYQKAFTVEYKEFQKMKRELGLNSKGFKGIIRDHLEVFIERIS